MRVLVKTYGILPERNYYKLTTPRQGGFFVLLTESKTMAKQRYINTKFWSDPWVVDDLNSLDRYLFLYLMTNEKTNIAGAYELSITTMSFETGIEKTLLANMLKRLEPKAYYKDGWVILTKGVKHQNHKNSKVQAGIKDALKNVPSDLLKLIDLPRDIYDSCMTHQETSHYDLDIDIDNDPDIDDDQALPEPVYVDEEFIAKPNKKISTSQFGNRKIQGIIKKRRELRWSTPFGGTKAEPKVAKHLLDLDEYAVIIKVMQHYQDRRNEPYMKNISNLEDLYRNYQAVKTKVLDNGVPPDVMELIEKDAEGYKQLENWSDEQKQQLIDKRIKRYRETGSWK